MRCYWSCLRIEEWGQRLYASKTSGAYEERRRGKRRGLYWPQALPGLTTPSSTKSSSAIHGPMVRSRDQTRMSRPRPAGRQTQEGLPSCGTASCQDLHADRLLGPHYPFRVKLSDTLLSKAYLLEYLPRVLTQQRGRPAWHDLGMPKTDIVSRQP